MCLAIWKPAGETISEAELEEAFRCNKDGAGFAAATGQAIVMQKGFFKFGKFLKAYNRFKDLPCLIHFRIRTHGYSDAANCHPFLFGKGSFAAIHNGTIDIKCTDFKHSDTWHFVHKVLEPLCDGINLGSPAARYLIEVAIGWSKMVVMDSKGGFVIYNEDKGSAHWEGKVWFSNYSHRKWTSTGTTTGANGNVTAHEGVGYCGSQGALGLPAGYRSGKRERVKVYTHDVEEAVERYVTEGGHLLTEGVTAPSQTADAATATTEATEATTPGTVTTDGAVTTSEQATGAGRGTLMEYGEFDEGVEEDIMVFMRAFKASRRDAIAGLRLHNQFPEVPAEGGTHGEL
jgi:hypothetical protein